MPELPDLQAFSQNLSRKLSGKRVEAVKVTYAKKLKTTEKDLQEAIEGSVLTSVQREGKEVHFAFDNGNTLGLHLMLKGQLHFFQTTNEHKFTIIELRFMGGTGLAMADFQRQATPTLNPEKRHAPDAMSEEAEYPFLKQKLNESKTTIKKLLMDQKVIRGIGNAYADEILWHAGISPFSVCYKIPDDRIRQLALSIRTVFNRAVEKILNTDPEVINGEVRDFLDIHNSEKSHSPTGAMILVDESSGRKTYYTDEQKKWE